jgi:hypothetical protein
MGCSANDDDDDDDDDKTDEGVEGAVMQDTAFQGGKTNISGFVGS